MATIFKSDEYDWRPHPNRIDRFRLFTDATRSKRGIEPKYLNFNFRRLSPGEYSAPYHFHRYADEMFLILSGRATLRAPEGLTVIGEHDAAFFEAGETGAHQLFNHTDEPCIYLDLCTRIGYDVCEYPDSGKLILVPGGETFRKSEQHAYFDDETNIDEIWRRLR